MKNKIIREDLPIHKGKLDIEYIEIDGKKLNLTPINHTSIENYITHKTCECGQEFEKQYTYDKLCPKCKIDQERKDYLNLSLVEWIDEFPLYLYDSTDQYFFDMESIEDYCDDEQIEKKDLQLVLCRQTKFPEISLEMITNDGELVYEDWEPSKEFEDKLKNFNMWLTNQKTSTWFPTNKRVQL